MEFFHCTKAQGDIFSSLLQILCQQKLNFESLGALYWHFLYFSHVWVLKGSAGVHTSPYNLDKFSVVVKKQTEMTQQKFASSLSNANEKTLR